MLTNRERLQATLVELQQDLAELEDLDTATRERLQATLADIRTALAQPEAGTRASDPESAAGSGIEKADQRPIAQADDTTLDDESASQTLAERLNDATRGLESTHPELSTTLGGVINALGQMGI